MARNALAVLAILLFFSVSVFSASKFCVDSYDCEEGKQCCGRVCLKRKSCDGSCTLDSDCDNIYGELCVDQLCTCVSTPCLEDQASSKILCQYNYQCQKNETCKDGVCQVIERTETQPLNTTVLVVVATIGLVVFAGAFYLCLRQQKSSRPSLAAKQAHHDAMERSKANSASIHSDSATSLKSDSTIDEERGNGRKHLDYKHFSHKKPPLSSPCSMVELSAIIEEDEVSEVIVSK